VKTEESAATGEALVHTLSQLTRNVERFDSMVRNQRHLLQRRDADPTAFDDRLLRRQSRRINSEAEEIRTRANSALEELRRLSPVVAPVDELSLWEALGAPGS
jgi:hypothetical protein